VLPDQPGLLNEKFKVHSYDGSAFKSKAQYDIKNVLVPIIEPFHCSGNGTKFNLVLKCSEDFTLTHFYVSGPGPRCTEPIKSGLVWVFEQPPDVERLKKYDSMRSEELLEIVKGLRTYSSSAGSVPDPCLYFSTDPTTREVELELPKWREGKYLVVKFLDSHNGQRNIDVGIVGLIGYTGRFAKQQIPLGPWMRRNARQPWVHPNELKSMFSSSGWVCDGRDFTGGCRSGQTDFHQTNVYTVTFRCTTSGFDLCEKCAHDPDLGRVSEKSMRSDLEALLDPALCKLAVSRLRNLWRRNWLESLAKYFKAGLLDNLVQALQKCTENQRPEDERAPNQRPSTETQKRQVRKALLQLLMELTQRLIGLGADFTQASDLVWAIRTESEGQEHWDEGRVVQQPKRFLESLGRPKPPPAGLAAATLARGTEGGAAQATEADESPVAGGSSAPTEAVNTEATEAATPAEAKDTAKEGHFLISWRDGQAPSWVHPQHIWRMADEDVVMATASLFLELAKGSHCDVAKLTKLLQQGADLAAVNGEGCPAILLAVRAEAPVPALTVLLENGACPDAAGREGVTALELLLRKERDESADAEWIRQSADVLRRHRAMLEGTQEEHEARIIELRRTFGVKMVGALLTVQSPMTLPTEILEALHLLFRDLPTEVVKESLEPQAYCALTALLQHLVGSNDNLGVALGGCRIMRALYNQPDLKLRYLIRSHGVRRWTERLSGDITQCGIHRQTHQDKVTQEELSKEAQLLNEELRQVREGETADFDTEWRSNQKLVEVVESLEAVREDTTGSAPGADGLFALRELLKKTEKGGIDDERCAAWELEQAGVPGQMLHYLKTESDQSTVATVNAERWKLFTEAFGDASKQSKKGLTRFIKAMHAVIETGEALPVWRHKKERGLKALTEAVSLKLRSIRSDVGKHSQPLLVAAEPLLQLADLTRFLTKVTPCVDEAYLQFCHRIIGHRIRDLHSEKEYEVGSFRLLSSGIPIPIHTVTDTDGESSEWVLATRAYRVLSDVSDAKVSQLELKVALNQLQGLCQAEEYAATLDRLQQKLNGEAEATTSEATEERPVFDTAFATVLRLGSEATQEVMDFVVGEKARCVPAVEPVAECGAEPTVDPAMRVHTVMIAVSDEIPFELFWPMVRDDIVAAVRQLCPRGVPGMEEAVRQGVVRNGMGPIAQKLTLQEAENLATRVGHVVQTGVTVDPEALQEAQKEKAKNQQNETIQLANRVQFSPKGDNTWVPGTVVGQVGECLCLVDDEGVLFDKLPRARVRLPPGPGKRDSLGSAGGTPIQAVLSQAGLVRIREHLRRRQEEWAERRAQQTGSSGNGARAVDEAAAGSEQRTPTSSRPNSSPVPALVHRSRASSAPSIDGAMRRGLLLSRDASLSEVDANGLDVVQFMEDEGMGDDDFDDDGEGPPDDEDEEDLALEANEDVDMAPRLGGSRGSDGEHRDFAEAAFMGEEYRMLEQLRAMEQIISEVLEPDTAGARSRRNNAEDFLSGAPGASLRIRMGGSGLRLPVEGMTQRRKGAATEPLRGEFPSFVRSADASSATATLDHPVVERLGVSDLCPPEGDVAMDTDGEGLASPVLSARFCLYPKESETGEEVPTKPMLLPRSWNLLKVVQFLQQLQSNAEAKADPNSILEPLQKVSLENWDLGYELIMECSGEAGQTPMEVDSGPRIAEPMVVLGNGKKRRRTLPCNELSNAAAREMYSDMTSRFAADGSPFEGAVLTPRQLVERCGDNITVTQAIELLRIMHNYAPSLNLDSNSWVSSKLDRKLRYQLEDPLSVISGTLPMWAVTLPKVCPFLFSLKTRKMLMKYTAFGPSFAVHWTQEHKVGTFLKRRATVQTELNAQTNPRKMQELSQELSNIEEQVVRSNYWLGTLQSTLVRLQKGEEFLRQADIAMGFLANASKLMEVQFEGETGFGVAVTQSFYVEVAQALQDRSVNSTIPMWVEDVDSGAGQQHLLCRKGLLLKPLPPGPLREQAVHRFCFLGRLMGQALREGFIVPLPLADEFFGLLLEEPLGKSNLPKPGDGVAGELLGALNDFLEDLASNEAQQREAAQHSEEEIQAWREAQAERSDFAERFLTANDRPDGQTQEPMSFNEYTQLLGLCFLETGLSGAELCPGGDSIAVNAENVTHFVEEAANFWFNTGVRDQVDAFRAGLNDVFPFKSLQAFTRTELREMFCGEDRIDWDEQALLNHIHPTGGLTDKSPAYKFLVAVLLELGQAERSRFLDFVSSCPRLPPGGIAKFHVDVFPDTSATRQAFPRSRACANQLYLPPYTSKEELQEKLVEAMHSSAGHHEQRVRDQ